MPNKLERFTQRARRVLSLAQEEAERLQHSTIGTEHLLMSFILEEGGVAGRVLRSLDVDQSRAQQLVEKMSPAGHRLPDTQLELSSDVKKVLELAVGVARQLDNHYIGTEHLLLGLINLNRGTAIDILKRLNISPHVVYEQTMLRISEEKPTQTNHPTISASGSENEPSLTGMHGLERFTQRARRVLSLAQEAAENLQHNTIGTEHLLLGIMREEGGVGARVLHDLKLEQGRLEEVIRQMPRAEQRDPNIPLDLADDTKDALKSAIDEAQRLGHHYIGTEHLLLGLVRRNCLAVEALKLLSISPEEVRRQTRRVLQEPSVQPNHPPTQDNSPQSADAS